MKPDPSSATIHRTSTGSLKCSESPRAGGGESGKIIDETQDSDDDDRTGWPAYYRKTWRGPWKSLAKGVELFSGEPSASRAVDCGCGTGRDTLYLLEKGFEVYAFDSHPAAIEHTRTVVPPALRPRLTAERVDFADVTIPRCDIFNASVSLFFAKPTVFKQLWDQVCRQLAPAGMFCGHFLGPRDEWLSGERELSFLSKSELLQRFSQFDILHLNEDDDVGPQAVGDDKHWHLFTVIARKNADSNR